MDRTLTYVPQDHHMRTSLLIHSYETVSLASEHTFTPTQRSEHTFTPTQRCCRIIGIHVWAACHTKCEKQTATPPQVWNTTPLVWKNNRLVGLTCRKYYNSIKNILIEIIEKQFTDFFHILLIILSYHLSSFRILRVTLFQARESTKPLSKYDFRA